MSTHGTVDVVTRRRFLLVAAAAASGAAATLAGCGTASDARGPGSSGPPAADAGKAPGAPSGQSGAGRVVGAAARRGPVPAPQALRGSGSRRTPGDPAAARSALSDFGIDFLRQARALDPSAANSAVSPYSLFTVLAMARAGAKGETAMQIDAALRAEGVDAQGAVISAVDAGVTAAVAAAKEMHRKEVDPMVIQPANQAWVQEGFQVRQSYLDELAVQYGVEAMAADFAADPEKMRAAINGWVSQRTNRLIPELFPQDSIDGSTVLVLVNALYLKSSWARSFEPGPVTAFDTGHGLVRAPMMVSPGAVRGTVGDGWTTATIPYLGQGLTMTLLVPDKGRFGAALNSFDAAGLGAAMADDKSVALTMPMFSIKSEPDAKAVAQRLGIRDIFTGSADLSGIAPESLHAETFVHQSVVKVDENGTEAAAATGMAFVGVSASVDRGVDVELTVDRPFLFWISETRTGAPLFLGAVTDPTASD